MNLTARSLAVVGKPYRVNVYDFPSTGLSSSMTVSPGVVKGQPFR